MTTQRTLSRANAAFAAFGNPIPAAAYRLFDLTRAEIARVQGEADFAPPLSALSRVELAHSAFGNPIPHGAFLLIDLVQTDCARSSARALESYRFKDPLSLGWVNIAARDSEDALETAVSLSGGVWIAELQAWDGVEYEPVEIYRLTNLQSGDQIATTEPESYASVMWHRQQVNAPAGAVVREACR